MRAIFGTLAGLGLLIGVTPVSAQQGGFSGSSSGGLSGSSSGGFSGSSSGGFSGSSAGGFSGGGGFSGSSSGGASGGGGFSGSSGGGFSGGGGGFSGSSSGGASGGGGFSGSGTNTGATGGRTTAGAGTTRYGTTSFLGAHFGNPLAMGAAASGSRSGVTSGTYPTSNYTNMSTTFGQPVYPTTVGGTATTGRTATLGGTGTMVGGTTLGGTMLGGQGTAGALGAAQAFRGANSAGISRAPQYLAQPVFDRIAPRPTVAVMRSDLQDVLSSSTRLPSGGRIQVMTEGEKVVLRGSVATDRERRIAEAMIRMTPGVRDVTNELVTDKTP